MSRFVISNDTLLRKIMASYFLKTEMLQLYMDWNYFKMFTQLCYKPMISYLLSLHSNQQISSFCQKFVSLLPKITSLQYILGLNIIVILGILSKIIDEYIENIYISEASVSTNENDTNIFNRLHFPVVKMTSFFSTCYIARLV